MEYLASPFSPATAGEKVAEGRMRGFPIIGAAVG